MVERGSTVYPSPPEPCSQIQTFITLWGMLVCKRVVVVEGGSILFHLLYIHIEHAYLQTYMPASDKHDLTFMDLFISGISRLLDFQKTGNSSNTEIWKY